MNDPFRNEKHAFHEGECVLVLLPRPFGDGFDYRVPEGMRLPAGAYVSVPFGASVLQGIVWGEGKQHLPPEKCKPVLQHHDAWPPLSEAIRAFIDWVAAYTLAPRGSVLKMMLPLPEAITNLPREPYYMLKHVEAGLLTPARKAVIEALQQTPCLSASTLRPLASSAVLKAMLTAGMLSRIEKNALPERVSFTAQPAPALRAEQLQAAQKMKEALGTGFRGFALEGITGSGKTEVYFDVIEAILAKNEGQILVLLPEIALTSQWMQRFTARFGDMAALWHSSIPLSRRKRIWQAVACGKAPLVVGARSALFLPYRDLRLIIVDEEHEASYKQEEGVLYHARDMAVARAHHAACPVLLCSATLSLETLSNCKSGKYTLLQLHERHGDYEEPRPELIDLRSDKPESGSFLAPRLREAMLATFAAGHQSMLFLNRRGYAPLLLCRSCGHRFACPNCSAWMVQHARPERLQCHHCDWRMSLPKKCPACQSEELAACGPGVERIAEEVSKIIPQAKQALLSSDESALPSQIDAILAGEVDIIIGTQMIAKGHHFPKLALVGIIDGDIGLEGGDLRAGERSFQLLHQLSGRAGREETRGRVLLQTTQPDHPLMQALARGDRDGFMKEELRLREVGGWPPFGRLASLLFEGTSEEAVRKAALSVIQAAPRYAGIGYLGPAPAAIARARGRYRYRILVKAPKQVNVQKLLQGWLSPLTLPSAVKLKVDIDPYSFM